MRYSLVIYKSENDMLEITNYVNISHYEILDETSLSDIIKFTNEWENEESLIEGLLIGGIIPKEYYNGTLGIASCRGKNGKLQLLNYGISYQEDIRFFSIAYLQNYFSKRIKDTKFMEAFLEKYYIYLSKTPLYAPLLGALREIYYKNTHNYHIDNEELNEAYESMMKFVTYSCTKKDNSTGKYKSSILGIRNLAMFAINYERKYIRKPDKNRFKSKNYLENIELQLKHYISLVENENTSYEAYVAYSKEIENLEFELELISNAGISRTRSNEEYETTEY